MSSLLVRVLGRRATLQHGDALVWDRWRWIARRLRVGIGSEAMQPSMPVTRVHVQTAAVV